MHLKVFIELLFKLHFFFKTIYTYIYLFANKLVFIMALIKNHLTVALT